MNAKGYQSKVRLLTDRSLCIPRFADACMRLLLLNGSARETVSRVVSASYGRRTGVLGQSRPPPSCLANTVDGLATGGYCLVCEDS